MHTLLNTASITGYMQFVAYTVLSKRTHPPSGLTPHVNGSKLAKTVVHTLLTSKNITGYVKKRSSEKAKMVLVDLVS